MTAAQLDGLLAKVPTALDALHHLSPNTQAIVMESAYQANARAFSMINLLGVLVALFGLTAAMILLKRNHCPRAQKH